MLRAPITEPAFPQSCYGKTCFAFTDTLAFLFHPQLWKWKGLSGGMHEWSWGTAPPLSPVCQEWLLWGSSLHQPSQDANSRLLSALTSFLPPFNQCFSSHKFDCQLSDFGSKYMAVDRRGSLIAGNMTLVKAVWNSLHFKTHSSFLIPQNLHYLFPADKRLLFVHPCDSFPFIFILGGKVCAFF